jgi:hypothetical protein
MPETKNFAGILTVDEFVSNFRLTAAQIATLLRLRLEGKLP